MSINTTKICDDLEIADEGTTVIAYSSLWCFRVEK